MSRDEIQSIKLKLDEPPQGFDIAELGQRLAGIIQPISFTQAEIIERRKREHESLVLGYMTQYNLTRDEAEQAIQSGIPQEALMGLNHYRFTVENGSLIDLSFSAIVTRYGVFRSDRKRVEIPKPKRRKNRLRIGR